MKKDRYDQIYPSNILSQNFIKIGKACLDKFAPKSLEEGDIDMSRV